MTLLDEVVAVAQSQVGVRETAPNRGPEVDTYHRVAGRDPALADSWCAEFVTYCYVTGAAQLGCDNPLPRAVSVHRLFAEVPQEWRTSDASQLPDGSIFGIDHGNGKGHCGLVVGTQDDGSLLTIEGNTNPGGSREGDGVYARVRQPAECTLGFIVPPG